MVDMDSKSYIKEIRVKKLWGKKDLAWIDVHEDVNILVGINGSGKTTLLNMIAAYYGNDDKTLKRYRGTITCNPIAEELYPLSFIRSFDVPVSDRRKSDSPLMQELNKVVIQNEEGLSFFNYRMKMLDYPQQATAIQSNIDELFKVIDNMFADTGKTVGISKGNNSSLVFQQDGETLLMSQLSSGEKQLLLLLISVFLQEKQPAILLMDEPEVSLHISWQQKLLESLRTLNPYCQLILSTHSPSIFSKGWGDRITFVEDLY